MLKPAGQAAIACAKFRIGSILIILSTLTRPSSAVQAQAASPVKAGAPAAAAASKVKPAATDSSQLAAGSFAVSPALGNLGPGEKMSLAITFAPSAAQVFEEQLTLDVSDR